MKFSITNSIANRIFHFGVYYGKLETKISDSIYENEFKKLIQIKSAISAINFDKKILEKVKFLKIIPDSKELKSLIGDEHYTHFENYLNTRLELDSYKKMDISLDDLKSIHTKIMGKGFDNSLRAGERNIPKLIVEDGISKYIDIQIVTKSTDIEENINSFLNWYNNTAEIESVLISAAISHIEIARIHPFEDGNGRLARMIEQIDLTYDKLVNPQLFSTELMLFENIERYHSILESTIKSGELTDWIEFYTEMALKSVNYSIELLKLMSAGTIDIANNKYIELTKPEQNVLEIFNLNAHSSPQKISEKLSYSRQNVYRIIRSLKEKGVISSQASKFTIH